jgi:hypothetical protein
MKQKLSLRISSSNELISFLKRFSAIESSLLIEIDNGFLKAKTHTPERSVVKSSKIELSRIFVDVPEMNESVLFGVYNIDKLMNTFKHFPEGGVDFVLDYEKTGDGNVGTSITVSNDSLKINFDCASLRLFTHITDDMMERISTTDSAVVDFVLSKENQNRILSLSTIDSDHKLLTFDVKEGKVSSLGKSFHLNLLSLENTSGETNISLYKQQFAYLDREDAIAYVSDDRIVFNSIETDTKTIIGKAD